MRAGSISVTFSVYVCICVNLSFFPSMVCCKYQLVEFLPIIPRTRVHSRPAIYDPALDFHSLVFFCFFFLLFPAVNKVLVSLGGRCLKNKQHSIIIDTKWTKGESLRLRNGNFKCIWKQNAGTIRSSTNTLTTTYEY